MWSIVLRAVLFGVLGMIVTPVLVMILGLTLAYSLDSRCGKPGDSGGCEMGVGSLAFVSIIPGALAGAGFGAWRGMRRRKLNA